MVYIPQATNIPYQPLLIKPIFSVLAHAKKNKTVFFKTSPSVNLAVLAVEERRPFFVENRKQTYFKELYFHKPKMLARKKRV